VAYYQDSQFDSAIRTFELAISIADDLSPSASSSATSLDIKTNLAHAYRRNTQFANSLATFSDVLRQGGKDAAIFSAKGLVLLELEEWFEATVTLHEALALSPQDPVATELLQRALEGLEGENREEAEDVDVDRILGERLAGAELRNRRRGRGGGGMEVRDDTEISVDEAEWTVADESEV
jgi:anaphase-promoting complex subunit 6